MVFSDLFGSSKPKISSVEFQKVLSSLSSSGFSREDLDNVKKIFLGDMERGSSYERGVDAKEIAERIAWLRQNMSKHTLSPHQIDTLEETLKKHL